MSMSEMPAGRRYVKLIFNEEEINVIKIACNSVALRERYLMMKDAAEADLETAASQARKASDSNMAEGLVSLFKAGQEIMIEPEDLAIVLDSLKAYGRSAPEENALVLKSVIEKIEHRVRV
jgi:hypothetical protein